LIRLNLGCGAPDERSWHPLPEPWINRDPALDGWRFEHGLGEYADGSVEAATISHALMYLPLDKWTAFFAEVARVLCDEGVLRITEDDTLDTRSQTYPNGWQGSQPCVTRTYPELVKRHMRQAGLVAEDCDATHTNFHDAAIMQDQHGGAPHVFYCEGRRMTRVLFSPHQDDEALFAAFTILKYRPRVVICMPSGGDYGDTDMRLAESRDACAILGAQSVEQWYGCANLADAMRAYHADVKPSLVFAPNERASHPEHVAVAVAAREVFGERRLRTYHTYDANGKVRDGTEAPYEPIWMQAKLRALARYESQIRHPRASAFFLNSLEEWLGD
jgi:LmbE family N-acetylglucosaminyl deacetylase/predicted SAM-dependent methyltransferase